MFETTPAGLVQAPPTTHVAALPTTTTSASSPRSIVVSVLRPAMATWSLPPSVWIVSTSWSLLARPVLAIVNTMWPTQLTVVVGTRRPGVVSTAKTPSPCANEAGAATFAPLIRTVSSPASSVSVMLSELSSAGESSSPTAVARPAATSAAVAVSRLRYGAVVMVRTSRPTVSTAPLTVRRSPPLSRSRSSSIPVRFSGRPEPEPS